MKKQKQTNIVIKGKPKRDDAELKSTNSQDMNEPEGVYLKSPKVLHFFKTIEEQEEDNYKWLASLTPQQHWSNATALIKRIYEADIKNNSGLSKKLTFEE